MKKLLFSLVALSALLIGCNSEDEKKATPEIEVQQVVKVEILTPATLLVGEEIELAAHVTQGKENVDDADSVKFEVWESGKREEGKMIDGEFVKDGVYKASYTFTHDGIYFLFAHTTARGLHVMPKQELTVGTPDMKQVLPDNSGNDMSGHLEDQVEDESAKNHKP